MLVFNSFQKKLRKCHWEKKKKTVVSSNFNSAWPTVNSLNTFLLWNKPMSTTDSDDCTISWIETIVMQYGQT